MIDLGDCQIGMEIVIAFTATDGVSPAWPDTTPQLVLFNGPDFLIRLAVSADPQNPSVGSFRLNQFLDARFPAAGSLHGFVQWSVDGAPFSRPVALRIVPGGSAEGTAISMAFVQRPSQSYILTANDSGELLKATNPQVTQ